jgi:hypothetical protein
MKLSGLNHGPPGIIMMIPRVLQRTTMSVAWTQTHGRVEEDEAHSPAMKRWN